MDLKKLRDEALAEANMAIREEKLRAFKSAVRKKVATIMANDEEIARLQKENEALRKDIAALDFEDHKDVTL